MSSTTFQVIFDGNLDSQLSNSEIDVSLLSGALASIGDLFEQADNCLNQGKTNHTLKVKGSFQTGSFKINFSSSQSIIEKVKSLPLFESQEIFTPEKIVEYLIGGGGLFALMKWLKGQKTIKILETKEGKYQVWRGDKYLEAEKKVIQLYQDYNVRKATEKAIYGTLSTEQISKIVFIKNKDKFHEITDSEKNFFTAPPEDQKIIREQTFEENIHLVKLSFKEGNKWLVNDGNTEYHVLVEDSNYLSKIQKNEVSFAKGDILKVNMRLLQYRISSNNKLKKEYFIEKVIDHQKAEIQKKIDI